MFQVMIVDDQESMRQMIRKILEKGEEFQIKCEADDGSEAVRLADEGGIDLVIMDVQMPEMDGFEATRKILERHPEVKVAMTSMNRDKEYERLSEEAGAIGFIPKPSLNVNALRQLLPSG